MTFLQGFWLGIVQGLGEFLPISSSGHLVLLQQIFGIKNDSMLLEVLLHVGTLAAVVAVYWRRLLEMVRHPIRSELWLLALATIPAVAFSLLFEDFSDAFVVNFLGYAFLLTTLILWFADLIGSVSPKNKEVKWYHALAMGVMQAVAILPGISRSGSTIAGGVATGLKRKDAADFSFLMSIPAILGSLALYAKDLFDGSATLVLENPAVILFSMAIAGVSGFFAIKLMLALVRRIRLSWFGLYTGILGALILLDQHWLHFFF